MAEKYTNRKFFEDVIANEHVLPEHVIEHAKAQIKKLDKANENRRNTPRTGAKAEENAPIADAIAELLEGVNGTALAKEIAEDLDITVQKCNAVLRMMVDAGRIERIEISRGKPLEYRLIKSVDEDTAEEVPEEVAEVIAESGE